MKNNNPEPRVECPTCGGMCEREKAALHDSVVLNENGEIVDWKWEYYSIAALDAVREIWNEIHFKGYVNDAHRIFAVKRLITQRWPEVKREG